MLILACPAGLGVLDSFGVEEEGKRAQDLLLAS